MNSITPAALKDQLATDKNLLLLDVREPEEHEAFNIGGQLIPLTELFDHVDEIPKDRPVVVYCKMGIRSQIAIQRLEGRYGYTNLINLRGGMEAWKQLSGDPSSH